MRLKAVFPWALTVLFFLWAVVATVMVFHNPLPFPDRGHRVFSVPDERARQTVVKIIDEVGGIKERFTFDSGASHQTLLWDGHTTIHYLDAEAKQGRNIPGNALSLAVDDPLASAKRTVELLQAAGYQATIVEGINLDLPPNHLIPVESNAFDGWLMVFRRPMIKMPYPKTRG